MERVRQPRLSWESLLLPGDGAGGQRKESYYTH